MGLQNVPINWAPPTGLNGETDHSDPAVGAHMAHLEVSEGRFTKPVECSACHSVPSSVTSLAHILGDDTPGQAELSFSFPANANSSEPTYDRNSASCSSVYCHGGKDANWTSTGIWTDCGSCHSIPPEALYVVRIFGTLWSIF